jgi:hypothetical protein
LKIGQPLRVVAAALVLSTLSFAGDLSMADGPTYGERVVLRLPPEIPADAPRAAPLPPMLSTVSAEASPMPRARRARPIEANFASLEPLEAPSADWTLLATPKFQTVLAANPDDRRKGV